MGENPSIAHNGARRSCDTEYENASSSLFASVNSAVRSPTRRSISSWAWRIARRLFGFRHVRNREKCHLLSRRIDDNFPTIGKDTFPARVEGVTVLPQSVMP